MTATATQNEAARMAALREAHVLDTEAEAAFDDIAQLAAQICQTPVALVSLVDEGRQWFKARVGLDAEETPREGSFCAHAIAQPGLFIVGDAAADERFVANQLVISAPNVRFYAGVPLVTEDGHALGTLCVIDSVPRQLSDAQSEALRVLAHHAAALLELRRRAHWLDETNRELRREAQEREAAERGREEVLAREGRARAEAEESERHYRFLAESIPQQVWTATPDGALDYVNRQVLNYSGLYEELLDAGWQQIVHPDDLAESLERWGHSLATGDTYEIEFRLRGAKDGEYRWHLGRALPMRDEAGRIVRWFGTNTDIDDQKRLYRVAQEANRSKDEFLATLSHELRTPLTSIMGWAEMLSLGMLDEAARRRAVEVIESSARSQAQLIADLLDVSRISAGRLRLEARPVDLRPVVEAALDVVRPAAEARSIKLSAKHDRKALTVSGDPDRLQQVVWNLVNNAVKFTPVGGGVEVSVARTADGQAEITVTDTGPGIDPDFLPYVFDRFRQGEHHMTRAHGGLGIGLSIVRHLVEMHGGTVRAESEGEGRGATFRVRLPLPPARGKVGARRRAKPGKETHAPAGA
jgi:PAS domain S-box-containing protein